MPRALLALQGDKEMKRFVKEARAFVGEDEFEMLETSLVFAEVGLAKEAAKLLSAVCVDAVPRAERSPLPLYYLAWFASLQNDHGDIRSVAEAGGGDLPRLRVPFASGGAGDPEICNSGESGRCLCASAHRAICTPTWAVRRSPVEHWQKAAELNPSLSVAYRNLGLNAWAAAERSGRRRSEFYKKAIDARPKDQTLYRDLAEILMAQGKRPDAIELLESMPSERLPRADIIIMLAQAYLDEQQYEPGDQAAGIHAVLRQLGRADDHVGPLPPGAHEARPGPL